MFYKELVGDIEQSHSFLKVTVDGVKQLSGYSGGRTWWFPLDGQKGLKVRNTESFTSREEAERKAAEIFGDALGLLVRATTSRRFLPDVYDSAVICHSGKSCRGERTLVYGKNKEAYYPGIVVERFDRALIPEPVFAEAKAALLQDGIRLRFDTYIQRNFGKRGNRYVIVDAAEPDKRKLL